MKKVIFLFMSTYGLVALVAGILYFNKYEPQPLKDYTPQPKFWSYGY